MAQYTCVDDTLKCLEWLENYRELINPANIRILKMYLRFLKTFLVSAEKSPTKDTCLKDLISYVQNWVQDAGKTIQSLCANSVEESPEAWPGKIEDLTSKVRTSFRSVLHLDAIVSDSCLMELIDSVLNNLNDLAGHKAKPNDSTKKRIEVLEVKFRFLRNFVWFNLQSCIQHQKLKELLGIIEAVATITACLGFQYLFEDMDIIILETEFSQDLLTIQLIEPELRYAYIRGVEFLRSAQVESCPIDFLRCFLNDLKELLSSKSYLKASARDHVRNLCEELNFVTAFLMDPPKPDDKEKAEHLLALTKAVAAKTAPVIHLLLVSIENEDVASEVDTNRLFDLLNEIDSIKKDMIKEKYLDLWTSIRSNLNPKAKALGLIDFKALGLIDFLLGTIHVVLNNKTDSIAFVGHQLEIVKSELVSLRSLLYVNYIVESEVTDVVHEAKHAIGSLIIRESPLWHCMLRLTNVIMKIQAVNNKVVDSCVRNQIVEIGGGTVTRNLGSSSSVDMPPGTDK